MPERRVKTFFEILVDRYSTNDYFLDREPTLAKKGEQKNDNQNRKKRIQ